MNDDLSNESVDDGEFLFVELCCFESREERSNVLMLLKNEGKEWISDEEDDERGERKTDIDLDLVEDIERSSSGHVGEQIGRAHV